MFPLCEGLRLPIFVGCVILFVSTRPRLVCAAISGRTSLFVSDSLRYACTMLSETSVTDGTIIFLGNETDFRNLLAMYI